MIKDLIIRFPLLFQITRFGIVGVIATCLHFSTVIFFVEMGYLTPLHANVFGFLNGFQVSYWGHRSWTFAEVDTLHRVALPRLLSVACFGFAINQSLFYIFLNFAHLTYPLALMCVLTIVPAITFTLSKFWVFR